MNQRLTKYYLLYSTMFLCFYAAEPLKAAAPPAAGSSAARASCLAKLNSLRINCKLFDAHCAFDEEKFPETLRQTLRKTLRRTDIERAGKTAEQLLQEVDDHLTEFCDVKFFVREQEEAKIRPTLSVMRDIGVASPEITLRGSSLIPLLSMPLEVSGSIVSKLLRRGVPVEGHPEDQYTPLMCAILMHNLPVAEALLDYGASISAKSKTPDAKTALELATLLGHKDIARAIAHEELQRNNLRKVTRHEMQAFTLGMHPRVGEESPVSLTSDPNIAHEIALHLLASYRQDPLPAPAHAQLIAQVSPGFVGGLWSSIGTAASYVPGAALWRSIKPPRK